MQLVETRTGLKGRRASIARARLSAIPTNPRWGRVMRAWPKADMGGQFCCAAPPACCCA